MTDKQLRKLRRSELLEMLMEIEQENETLAEENRVLRQKLADKELRVEKAGSLAEACLNVSGMLDAAQQAADAYMENIRRRAEAHEAEVEARVRDREAFCALLARDTALVCRGALDEPEKAKDVEARIAALENGYGPCDLELPYQVPEGQFFVMGDQRASSIDSRMTQVGCVASEQIVGQIILCIWPFDHFGRIEP